MLGSWLGFSFVPGPVSGAELRAGSFHLDAQAATEMRARPFHEIAAFNAASPISTSLSPGIVRRAYGFDRLPNEGRGQTVAIVSAYTHPRIQADLKVFTKTFGLRPCNTGNGCLQRVFASGRPPVSVDWAVETALDVEWLHALAPRAKILLVEAASDSGSDLLWAVIVAVARGASVVAMSWGGPESPYEVTSLDRIFHWPKKNVSFVAASGNSGGGFVYYPAASPFVLGVGGTSLAVGLDGSYLGETAWALGSGGLSAYAAIPDFQRSRPMPLQPMTARGVPDVAYNADPEFGFAVFSSISPDGPGWMQVGGTSAGAPQWAAVVAISNSLRKATRKQPFGERSRLTLQSALYRTAGADTLHDITNGSNGSCGILCTALPGYDFTTGLGSPVADRLAPALAAQ